MAKFSDWLPPLQCLRAFSVVVRTGNISLAARELQLTNSAISHHLSQLEAWLGVQLFERHRRGVRPSEAALLLAGEVDESLQNLRSALARARQTQRQALTLTLLPALAQRWLLPRLGDFAERFPDLDLRLVPAAQLVDLERQGIDLALRYGPGDWPGVKADHLSDEWLFPVARPDLAQSLADPEAIAAAPLIRNPSQPWHPWFMAAGLTGHQEPDRGLIIHDAGMALDLALQGQGVALARSRLVEGELARGQLARLSTVAARDSYGYYAVTASSTHPALPAVIDWLKQAFNESQPANLAR
ncbi:LysR substrate-binding domain-containing protein [Lacibacterium aquatile]|uniref:LysR substrate-binding domain-containing protein n=1 Tax=Lacibacterium aquatile TaxID=1168082 RepID=A0ABW5DUD1_9PROT